jgi:transketolase
VEKAILEKFLEDFDFHVKNIRLEILKLNMELGEGHIPSSFSIVDVLHGLYALRVNFESAESDVFILSKGHAAFALYATLIEHLYIKPNHVEDLNFRREKFGGHPDRNKLSQIEASTGSLGHGLPIAVGRALADKALGRDRFIFVLVGDGELNEGSCWEAFSLMERHKLNNVRVIIDRNHSNDDSLDLFDIQSKLQAFNFEVLSFNGHSKYEISEAISISRLEKPLVLIADTTKGYGIELLENAREWHHKNPSREQLKEFVLELERRFA